MADDDSSSDLSSLPSLSPPPSGDDEDIELKRDNKGILKFFQKVNPPEAAEARKSPPPRKREPSPPHEHVFADNPAIAVSLIRVTVATKREKARSVALAQLGLTRHTVYRHVSQAIRQCYAPIFGAFRTYRARTGYPARPSRRTRRTFSVRRPWLAVEPKAGYQVRISNRVMPRSYRCQFALAYISREALLLLEGITALLAWGLPWLDRRMQRPETDRRPHTTQTSNRLTRRH